MSDMQGIQVFALVRELFIVSKDTIEEVLP